MGKCKSSPCFETTKLTISCLNMLLWSSKQNIYMYVTDFIFNLIVSIFLTRIICGRINFENCWTEVVKCA
jgi:hypothetical protein